MTSKTADRYSAGMRILFILLVLGNIAVFGLGQGWFGTPRSELGRSPANLQKQVNADAVRVLPGQLQAR